jgi:CspA family cold shock protein
LTGIQPRLPPGSSKNQPNEWRGAAMAEGTVKWYNEKKGYGFISSEAEGEIFFHHSDIADHGHFGLQKNDRVGFDIRNTPKGRQAIKVKVL